MTVLMGSDLASGGWDALQNITTGIGKGSNQLVSSFFPTPQRETIISETTQAAGGTGQTYRPTAQENQSMIETAKMSAAGWYGSPYQENLSVSAKRTESTQLASSVEPQRDIIGESLQWALEQTKKVTTLVDMITGDYEPREVIKEEPRAGAPEGKDVRNINQIVERGAEVVKAGASWAGQIFDQVKGLFNLGFDQTGKQPVFSIQHELEPTTKIGIGVIAAFIILILLLRKR